MKKLFVLLAGALMVASVAWAADEEIKELDANKLPPITKSILKSYFPGTEVVKTTKSKSKVRNSFNVSLNDGTELECDKDGQWQRVYCGGKPVPKTMVNLRVVSYLENNLPGAEVVLMEKDKKGNYLMQLSDGTELHFDNQFRPMEQ